MMSADDSNKMHKLDSTARLKHLNSLETKCMPYIDSDLLDYVSMGELPPVLIDLIDRLNIDIYYDGHIILEVRDFRYQSRMMASGAQSSSHFVLLRPTTQTFIADLNCISNEGNYIWYQEDKFALESQLLLAVSKKLHLEPNLNVSIIKSSMETQRLKFNDPILKKYSYLLVPFLLLLLLFMHKNKILFFIRKLNWFSRRNYQQIVRRNDQMIKYKDFVWNIRRKLQRESTKSSICERIGAPIKSFEKKVFSTNKIVSFSNLKVRKTTKKINNKKFI